MVVDEGTDEVSESQGRSTAEAAFTRPGMHGEELDSQTKSVVAQESRTQTDA